MTEQTPRTAAEWKAYGERMARAKAQHRQQIARQPRRPGLLELMWADDTALTLGLLFGRRRPRRK